MENKTNIVKGNLMQAKWKLNWKKSTKKEIKVIRGKSYNHLRWKEEEITKEIEEKKLKEINGNQKKNKRNYIYLNLIQK